MALAFYLLYEVCDILGRKSCQYAPKEGPVCSLVSVPGVGHELPEVRVLHCLNPDPLDGELSACGHYDMFDLLLEHILLDPREDLLEVCPGALVLLGEEDKLWG